VSDDEPPLRPIIQASDNSGNPSPTRPVVRSGKTLNPSRSSTLIGIYAASAQIAYTTTGRS
jgi:hypothetical protein